MSNNTERPCIEWAITGLMGASIPAIAHSTLGKPFFWKPWRHVVFGLGFAYLFSGVFAMGHPDFDGTNARLAASNAERQIELLGFKQEYLKLKESQDEAREEKLIAYRHHLASETSH